MPSPGAGDQSRRVALIMDWPARSSRRGRPRNWWISFARSYARLPTEPKSITPWGWDGPRGESGTRRYAVIAAPWSSGPISPKRLATWAMRFSSLIGWTRRSPASGALFELNPGQAEFWKNLGNALARQGKPEEAIRCYEQALSLNSDYSVCRADLATTLLQLGDYERGWVEFEWRWRDSDFARQIPRPLWDGSPLEGRTILLIAEQGLGDTLQFIRYAPLVKERGGTVIVAAQKALLPLLESCPGVDHLVAQDGVQTDFDVFAPLMSLPRILGTTLQTVPAPVPYLHARPELVEQWQRELRPLGRFLIAVAWQGSPKYAHDRLRSFRLAQLEPLARLPGVTLISLQKGPGAEQIREVSHRFPIVDLTDRIDRDTGPFLDTAAIVQSVDLVIGCDSSLVHLAGALGVPVWVAHTSVCDWRWMLGRDDSPWYPSSPALSSDEPGRLGRRLRPDGGGACGPARGPADDRVGADRGCAR